jgi:hypothetical protein
MELKRSKQGGQLRQYLSFITYTQHENALPDVPSRPDHELSDLVLGEASVLGRLLLAVLRPAGAVPRPLPRPPLRTELCSSATSLRSCHLLAQGRALLKFGKFMSPPARFIFTQVDLPYGEAGRESLHFC